MNGLKITVDVISTSKEHAKQMEALKDREIEVVSISYEDQDMKDPLLKECEIRIPSLNKTMKLNNVVLKYENIEEFWEKNPFSPRHFFATTKTTQNYFEAKFEVGDYFYFGREDAGLPQEILDKSKEACITIPMTNEARSLNIANSVSIIAYEALRQNYNDFK